MKERGGMPYDVVAFEADEDAFALSEAEEGIFHRMLRKAWMNGSVPADLTALADLCRVRPSTMKKAWPKLSRLWQPCGENPERLRNKKQESERIFLESKRESARESAKLSWKSKKRKTNRKANAERTQSDGIASHPLPSPSHPNSNDKPTVSLYGEFGRAQLTDLEHSKLKLKLNGSLDIYIARFDRWVNEAPTAKDRSGIRRQDRHAYESISSWFDKDGPKNGNGGSGNGQKSKPSDEDYEESTRLNEEREINARQNLEYLRGKN